MSAPGLSGFGVIQWLRFQGGYCRNLRPGKANLYPLTAPHGVRRYSYHTIRHFVASFLYDKMKRPISEISKLLRHTNVQTTERYLQLVDPHLRDTMRLLEGDVVAWLAGERPGSETPTHHHLLTDLLTVERRKNS